MSFEVGVIKKFEAAHSLRGEKFGPASRVHGHTYKVEACVRGPKLSGDGVLTDIIVLKSELQSVLERLHYSFLNEVDGLEDKNTTTEELARFIHRSIKKKIKDEGIRSLTVTVWENEDGYAAFSDNI